jgi:low affinity Fe/Cu permease
MKDTFNKFARKTSTIIGSPYAFIFAVTLLILWAISGPVLGFSENWQLVINTSTTIITFLIVFLIQNTQNRDSVAIHLKLDELIRSTKKARNKLIDLEDLSDEEVEKIKDQFAKKGQKIIPKERKE